MRLQPRAWRRVTEKGQERLQQVVLGVEHRLPMLVRVSAVDENDIGKRQRINLEMIRIKVVFLSRYCNRNAEERITIRYCTLCVEDQKNRGKDKREETLRKARATGPKSP